MASETETPVKNHSALITQIVTGALGAILLTMQGVNISETGSNATLIRHVEQALRQQTDLISQVTAEGTRIDTALKNQDEMLYRLDAMIKNESEMIDLLRKGQPHS
jgi:hypothetical protein